MEELYIIGDCYQPNTAPVNRFLAFAKGYGVEGTKTKVVFIFPNKEKDTVQEIYENVEFVYLWKKYCPKNKYLRHLVIRLFLIEFLFNLNRDKTIILYGAVNFLFLFWLLKKNKIFHERTECPDLFWDTGSIIGKFEYWLYKRACKNIDGLFVISPSIKNFFVKNFDVPKEKIHTINMIVDATRFDFIQVPKKTHTIAYCGTISERKDGISDLLKAFKIVSEQYHDITLTLIGGFENKITKDRVYNLLQALGIVDKVIITGVISVEQMPLLLSEAKILVLSRPKNKQSQYGFPTKLGEYLMTENPVVITDVGDFKSYLRDKEDVIYALPDNYEDFARKLNWVLDNYELSKKIAMNGKKVALDSFNFRTEARKVLDVVYSVKILN
jgi:glycosyltransferase involved in cell wall biosynthesis